CQLIPGDYLVDHRARQVHGLASIRREQYRLARYCDLAHILQSEIVSSEMQSVQKSPRVIRHFPVAARNTLRYLSGKAETFISEFVTICVVSPSASTVPVLARVNS